jgi:hypothetical protein
MLTKMESMNDQRGKEKPASRGGSEKIYSCRDTTGFYYWRSHEEKPCLAVPCLAVP